MGMCVLELSFSGAATLSHNYFIPSNIETLYEVYSNKLPHYRFI